MKAANPPNRADALLELQSALGNAAVSRLIQRDVATEIKVPPTEAVAAKQSREAKAAFDSGNYKRAIELWEPVRLWAASNAPNIELSVTYYLAFAEARAGDMELAVRYADQYRSRPQHDPKKLEELLETIHSDAEHAQPVPKVESTAQAETVWKQADQAYAQGDFDRASALWRAVAEWASSHDPKIEASAVYDIAIAKAHAGDYGSATAAAKRYHSLPGREFERDEHLDDRLAEIRDENEPPQGGAKVRTKTGAEQTFREAEAAYAAANYEEAIRLWQAVADWAAAQGAADILAPVVYNIAIAKARAGDIAGAKAAAARYRTLPGADPQREAGLPKRIEEIEAQNARDQALLAPKTRDDASKTFDEAKKAFDAGDYKWAIALWEAVLDWAAHSGGSEQAHIVADTTYALALAKAHAGDLAEAYADAKKYATLPGADAAKAKQLNERVHEIELGR